LFPAENPKFPGVRIGQYSPLVGERPFRRPANSGSVVVSYTRDKASVALAGSFFGRADDSTYLSDEFFGYSMLLPNQGLDPGYQKFNLSGSYQVHPRVRGYLTVENVFDERFAAASGFPSLPRSVRAGAAISLGGR
jgi:iron complex outermembrane receptor protein/vitamin B12 transporter